jgi:hypothetical protein
MVFPFKTMLGTIVACYLIVEKTPESGITVRFPKDGKELTAYKTEFYPLSGFPMYSTFADNVFYVFLTDAQGQPVRLNDIPGATASAMTKEYNQTRDDLKAKKKLKGKDADTPLELRKEAGLAMFRNLMGNLSRPWFSERPNEKFKLMEGVITQKDGKVNHRITELAELSFAELPAQANAKP